MRFNQRADALGNFASLAETDLRQQCDELLTAIPGKHIIAAQLGFDQAGHVPQYLVPGLMAKIVIDALELVDIKEHACQRLLMASRPRYFFVASRLEVTAVIDAGQRVGQTGQFETLVVQRIFQADGKDRRQSFEEVGAAVRSKPVRIAASQIQATDEFVLPNQRQQRHRFAPGGPGIEYGFLQFGIEIPEVRALLFRIQFFQQNQPDGLGTDCATTFQNARDLIFGIGQHQRDCVDIKRRFVVFQYDLNEFCQRVGGNQALLQYAQAKQLLFIQARFFQQGLKLATQELVFSIQNDLRSRIFLVCQNCSSELPQYSSPEYLDLYLYQCAWKPVLRWGYSGPAKSGLRIVAGKSG